MFYLNPAISACACWSYLPYCYYEQSHATQRLAAMNAMKAVKAMKAMKAMKATRA